MTDSVPHVFTAISEVTRQLKQTGIGKEGRNKDQNYNFRGIDQVYQSLCPLLVEAQLIVTPRVISREIQERATKSGGKMFNVSLTVEYDFVSAVDGSKHTTRVVGEGQDTSDKATNKAMSAAYKYNAIQAFCIPVEGEPDADAETPEDTVIEPAPKPAQNRRQRAQETEGAGESTTDEPAKEAAVGERLNAVQQAEVSLLLERSGSDEAKFLEYYKAKSVAELRVSDFGAIQQVLNKKLLKLTEGTGKVKGFNGVRK